MIIANVVSVILILIFAVMIQVGGNKQEKERGPFYWVGQYGQIGLMCLFSVIWIVFLFTLFTRVKNSEKLIPNKRLFIMHGVLIFAFLVIYLSSVVLSQQANKRSKEGQSYLRLKGWAFLISDVANLIEAVTFFLVVLLMLPVT